VADCCAEIRNELAALRAEVAKLKPVNEESIISRALNAADAKWGLTLGIPVAFGAIIKINGLKSELDIVKSIGQEALSGSLTARNAAATAQSYAKNAEAIATKAQGSAASALAQVIALAASVGALLIVIGTIAALGSRIDQVERGVAMLSDDVSKIIAQLGIAKAEARSALQKVESAIIRAEAAFGLASSADGRSNIADSTANRAIGEARGAIQYAKNVAVTAEAAIAKANDAIVKGNQAINQANQALSRVTIVEPKVQQAQTTADKAQGTADKAQGTAEKAFAEAKKAREYVDRKVGDLRIETQTKIVPDGIWREVPPITIKLVGGIVDPLKQADTKLANEINEINQKYGDISRLSDVDRIQRETELELAKFKRDADLNAKQSQGDLALLRKRFDQTVKDFDDAWTASRKENIGFNEALKRIESQRLPTLEAKQQQQDRDLEKIDDRLKEQEEVNRDGARKLDQLVPTIGGIDRKLEQIIPSIGAIPLIPGRVINGIKPSIPTIPQIKKATKDGVCEEFQGNGCGINALNTNASNISNNINRGLGGKLDSLAQGFNTGANAVQLTLLNTINTKLGAQVQGGISGALSRFTSWLQLDRLLNILTFAATVHNALMLSNDIGQTFIGIINNVLQLIGLKDEKGGNIDVSKLISSSIENLIKGAIGAENYQQLNTAWSKANRIYQASVNILNNFQNLASTILTALEMTAGKVAKIGNALRSAGEVLENAYGWMNPQPKYNRVTQTLESLQNGASTIQMVTQAPLDIIQATTELTNSATELTNAIKDDTKDENKGKEAPEPDKLKEDKQASKTASAGKEITSADLDPDD
jgi:hypothetical protein